MKFSDMNKTEQKAFMQVVHATNWVIGGYENSVMDGHMEEMPSATELENEVYDTVMTCTTDEGLQTFRPIKEIRFVGTEWLKERITRRVKKVLAE